ncbi:MULTISPECIES: hypothetical protein [unclassified Bradyrhizobium]
MPPFLRMAWASAAARDRWSEPLGRLVNEIRISEWLSVAAGVRLAAIMAVPKARSSAQSAEWANRGLASRILGPADAPLVRVLNGKSSSVAASDEVHLVTRNERIEQLASIWRAADLGQMADWLGYPSCCAAFLKTVAIERQELDTTWAMVEGHVVDDNASQIAEIDDCTVNPLLSALGLRSAPHRPCCFHCQATQRLASVYGDLRSKVSSQPDQGALGQALAWPVEWSSLHGIVEVKLPILTLCYDGDATATAYKVRLTGGAPPEHAAQGLGFPYQTPQRRRPRTDAG